TAKGEPLLPPVLKRFADDPAFGAVVYGCMPVLHTRERIYGEAIAAAASLIDKPSIALHYGAPGLTDGMVRTLRGAGLLVFDPPEAGVRALRWWSRWSGGDAPGTPQVPATQRMPTDLAQKLRGWRAGGRHVVTEFDAAGLARACGIPVAAATVALDEEAAVRAAVAIGGPVALKALSALVTHRAQVGAIELGLRDEVSVRAAYRAICARVATIPGAHLEGMLVQEMLPSGLELVAGLKRDPQFGAVVVLGLGGVLVELLGRVAIRRPPVDRATIADMLDEVGLADRFNADDHQQLAVIMAGLARLGEAAEGAIAEVDLNPLLRGADGRLRAADALLVLAP
ncbi:MAG TPA: acetate--CoA ligase family protein, partial [Candidatus Saccharimonadales bacterium]|nr:acetate--CoA ligase family protein [Candidatus Saccharimonadales bacterium]